MGRLRALLLVLLGWWVTLASAAAPVAADIRLYHIGDLDVPASEVVAGRHDATAIAQPSPIIKPTERVGGWWRVDVLHDLPAEPSHSLVVDAPNHTVTNVWLPGKASPLVRATTGADADTTYSPRLAVFDLPDGLRTDQHVYLYLKSSARYPDAVRIMDSQALRAQDRRDMQLNTLIAGTLLALVLVGIGMGLMLRETDFLLLGFGLAFALLFLLDSTAELYRIPGFAWLTGVRITQKVLATGAAVYMALFVLRYLRMAERTPVLARVQWGVIWTYLAVLACSCLPVIGLSPTWSLIGNLTMVVSSIVEITAATKGAIAGHRSSRMFLWSWAPLFFFLGWRVLELGMRWPANDLLQFAFPGSFVLAGALMMIGLSDRMLKYKRERDASDLLARRDPLTEVYNRRALDERLHAAALETGQSSQPLALLFIDLDHFKRINDEHGHDAGDECLREVARRVRATLRFGDVLGRYGGEEFVIGLPNMQAEAASAMGERIRQAVGSRPIACNGVEVSITVSIGVAMLQDGLAGFDAAIKRADRALYASKRDGRDRVSTL
ncbi:MAG TPA: diguanylate cyclase [Xanthomonadaceae bacterium]